MCYSSSSLMGSDQLTSIIAFLELQAQICHETLIPSHTPPTTSCLLLCSYGVGTIHFPSIVWQHLPGSTILCAGCNKSKEAEFLPRSLGQIAFFKVKFHTVLLPNTCPDTGKVPSWNDLQSDHFLHLPLHLLIINPEIQLFQCTLIFCSWQQNRSPGTYIRIKLAFIDTLLVFSCF